MVVPCNLFQFWDALIKCAIPDRCLNDGEMEIHFGVTYNMDAPLDVMIPEHPMEVMQNFGVEKHGRADNIQPFQQGSIMPFKFC